ncbi:MAG: dihydropteroate synthase [Rhodospirillaceae bacterium]|jgi:dihydropteroate synthase|nr:dihydropteroate synthase [Rhodospirillaceae bacterium]MBT5375037.1 dihydropteroate synthase [Rhodospirillaceae bacterium]MBT5751289.1 dihydropteroate synthase [Rhodospirillaceae bacterium]
MVAEDKAVFPELDAVLSRGRPRLYLQPSGYLTGAAAGAALDAGCGLRLAGGRFVFSLCEVLALEAGAQMPISMPMSLDGFRAWAAGLPDHYRERLESLLEKAAAFRPPFAGLPLDGAGGKGALVMGIVNVTPDSFSDGGDHTEAGAAIAHGLALMEAGADILDVGGESTRPGAEPVAKDEELKRVLPVIKGLARAGAVVSIDTRHAEVMAAALGAGAKIINDVSALEGDPESLQVAAVSGAPVILMHMYGDPRTMQDDPVYTCAPLDIYDYLENRLDVCRQAGIGADRIIVDPGIGFGKTFVHNADILSRLSLYHGLGTGILLGVSRKRFIAGAAGGTAPKERLSGSLAAALGGLDQGVQIIRVHDVAETRQAVAVWDVLHPVV